MNLLHLARTNRGLGLGVLTLCLASSAFAGGNAFNEDDLVSDIPGRARNTDPNLVNPWGISFSPTSPFWIADNGSGKSTLYNSKGGAIGLVVTLPGATADGAAPTGTVFNSTSAFNGDKFIFASEDGIISGWRGALGTSGEVLANKSGVGAVYKGLAIASTSGNSYLYATDFHNDQIDWWSSAGAPGLTGSFSDPSLPGGYAPFNIQNLNGKLYVTYAQQDADAHDDVAGLGHGFIDEFDLNGNLLNRLVSGGQLDSPWGLAVAPVGFGNLSGDLLVGNFGNGMINAFDPTSGIFVDSLRNAEGDPLAIDGLWGLAFGNASADPSSLYFTAGIPGDGAVEDHGLFGRISAVPEPGTGAAGGMLVAAVGGLLLYRRRRATQL